MTRFARRWVWVFVLAFAASASAQKVSPRPVADDQPNAETLKRLAEQLAGGNPQTPNIDPELLKLAAKYLEKNPDLLNDPNFQQQVQQYQQQAKQNPEQFSKLLQQQNPGLSQQQVEDLKQKFQQGNSGGFTPLPGDPTPTTAQTTPNGQSPPRPPIGGPAPPPPPPIPLPPGLQPRPGQQTPFTPQVVPPKFIGPDGSQWQSAADKAQSKTEYHQAVGLWEQNFGSIEQTPAMKQALVDMFSGEGKSPWDGSGNGNNPWNGPNGKPGGQKPWDMSGGPNGNQQSGFMQWLKNSTPSGPPTWWKNMTSNWNNSHTPPPNVGGSGWKPPQTSGGSFGGGFSGGDVSGAATPVVILVVVIVAAVAAFLVWRYWPQIQALRNGPKPIPGLGPWTIDPRNVVDRETLVKAFEYLSVLICGDGARVWNHQTIADAFRENVPGAAPFADPLARLYALARYSPANEPIAPADIAEARGYLCRLAGVPG